MSNCGCGCNDAITTTEGSAGRDGTSVVLSTSGLSGAASVEYLYTANRLSTASNDIYNTGAGYQWSILTVPAVSAANVMTLNVSAQINASDVHTVTATLLVGGAPVATVSAVQSCGINQSMNFNFQTSGLTTGSTVIIKLVSNGALVTPVLTSGNAIVNIYC